MTVSRLAFRVVERRRVRTLRYSHGSGAGDQTPERHDPGRRSGGSHRQVRQQSDVAGRWSVCPGGQEQRS